MVNDVAVAKSAGVAGVVIGAAAPDGRLEAAVLARLVEAAAPLNVTLNRVFDLTPDPVEALETAIELGIRRVLTSGQAPAAGEGVDLIAELVKVAGDRIEIMAGGGVTPDTAPLLVAAGVGAIHASCSETVEANPSLGRFGFGQWRETRADAVRALKAAMASEKMA